ncbi:glycosyltransferase [bacterium]|nr:glycosyltransferase [bacterium]
MKVSIIVPAYNEELILPKSLQSIIGAKEAFQQRAWETELIVVDNNSTDKTPLIAKKFGAKVEFEPINQIGRARNKGAKAATGNWLLFVDADSFPSRGLFSKVATEIERGDCIGGGASMRLCNKKGYGLLAVRIWNSIGYFFNWAAGSFIFCETAAFNAINGFNLNLFIAEEIEFCQKLKAYGKSEKKFVKIIRSPALSTSDRKFRLYSFRENAQMIFRLAFSPMKLLRSRNLCFYWYDGRR